MADKMMRVSGRFENDDKSVSKAKSVRVTEEGYLLTNPITKSKDIELNLAYKKVVPANGHAFFVVTVTQPHSYSIKIEGQTNNAWELTSNDYISYGVAGEDQLSNRNSIMKSNGLKLIVGRGIKSSAISETITSTNRKQLVRFDNHSDTEITMSLTLTKKELGTVSSEIKEPKKSIYVDVLNNLTEANQSEVHVYINYNPVKLEYLEFFTSGELTQISLSYFSDKGEKVTLGILRADSGYGSGMNPKEAINSSLWEINHYDRDEKTYKISLRKSLEFPNGLVIGINNTFGSVANTSSVRGYGVENYD